ncbi:MAG: hypothetical protein AAB449_01730 [Patescibacteria group bacterium]
MTIDWKGLFLWLFRGATQMGDTNPRVILSLPPQTLEAILGLKLLPEDNLTQVFKDALETHNQVVGALRSGGTLFVHKGAKVIPLSVDHLTTPQVRRASFEIIKGGRDD